MTLPPATAILPGSQGPVELLVVFTLILLLFGAKRLPDVARKLGGVIMDLRRASQDFRDQLMTDVDVDDDHPENHHIAPPEKTAHDMPDESTTEPDDDR